MALRIDFFSVEPGHDLEREDIGALVGDDGHRPDAVVRWEGHVAASDADEGSLVELAGLWSTHGVLDGIGVHGVSETPQDVAATDAAVLAQLDDAALASIGGAGGAALLREWSGVASHCVAETVASGRHVGWWTRFDAGGSADAGAEEWPTGSSIRGLG